MEQQILVVGHFSLDTTVLYGQQQAFFDIPAGSALGAALGARVWAKKIGIVTRVGSDFPRNSLELLSDLNFYVEGVRIIEGKTLRFLMLKDLDEESAFLSFQGNNMGVFTPTIHDIPEFSSDVTHVHLAPMPLYSQLEFARLFKSKGAYVTVDPHPLNYWGSEQENRNLLSQLYEHIDVLLPSAYESRQIWKYTSIKELIHELHNVPVRTIVVKNGSKGSFVYNQGNVTFIPIFNTESLETTGAGDAYCGGFISHYAIGNNVVEAAIAGTVSASYAVEHIDRFGMLRDVQDKDKRFSLVEAGLKLGSDVIY